MDRTSDELCQDCEKHILVNHQLRLQGDGLANAGSVSNQAAVPVKPHIPPQSSFPFENSHPLFPEGYSHEYSQSSGHDALTTAIQSAPAGQNVASTISSRRGINLNLPSFDGLPRSPVAEMGETAHLNLDTSRSDESTSSTALTRVSSFPATIGSASVGPPTPPHDAELSLWLFQAQTSNHTSRSVDTNAAPVPAHQSAIVSSDHALHQGTVATSEIELSNLNFAGTSWFQKVLGLVCGPIDIDASIHSVKLISQILPMNASDQRAVKTYEMICDRIQQVSTEPRTITITHARKISPGQVVEDFPKSPPATPYRIGGDSYFGDQTIFTHVAEVPVHHDLRYASQALETTAQRHIMTAEASNIILERYIPPTTAEENIDLFDANSCRSYLADRLPELAPSTGSLIFIYPTKTGAQTFARRYIGPVLDPLLREMSILKGLNTNAAERLGRMNSIESMFEFNEIRAKLQALCDSMNTRVAFQRTRTEFVIEHSDTAQVVLDRNTWMTWFVEQEQQRLKQDLVDYHREGGRLPDTENANTEVTAGMLSREIADGLKKSTKMISEAGIEVGIFVVRRHRRKAIP